MRQRLNVVGLQSRAINRQTTEPRRQTNLVSCDLTSFESRSTQEATQRLLSQVKSSPIPNYLSKQQNYPTRTSSYHRCRGLAKSPRVMGKFSTQIQRSCHFKLHCMPPEYSSPISIYPPTMSPIGQARAIAIVPSAAPASACARCEER